ncbi:MAG: metallophosphoesterase [Pseudomonadota bacterium]
MAEHMPRDIRFVSDTHFGHGAVIAFGKRPFADANEMDAAMAERWRARVKDTDLVFHLGDVAWTRAGLRLFASLPGTKRLILGNHDARETTAHVQRLYLFRRFTDDGFIASHMPMMMERGREPINVHGHVHAVDVAFPGYVNISVEKTDYAPLHLDELRLRVKAERARLDAFVAENDLAADA